MRRDSERMRAVQEMPVSGNVMDLWDAGTFDPDLLDLLHGHADLLRSHEETERRIFLEHDHGPGRAGLSLRPGNPFAAARLLLGEAVTEAMRARTIRAFHYTRMTDGEVAAMRRDGIHLSTPETLRRRLDGSVAEGLLTAAEADALEAASPFRGQHGVRADRFWLTSHPVSLDDPGVDPLLRHWGGEVASMCLKDEALIERVQAIGRRRIIEVAVPLGRTKASDRAADTALATFARSLGCVMSKQAIDVCVTAALRPEAILAVHAEGEDAFAAMGRGYPAGFVDVSLTYWRDLTGEDD